MRGYPPGTGEGDPADFSVRHQAHDLAGAVVFGSGPLTALAAAFTLTSTSWRVAAVVVAAVTAALTVAFGAAWEPDRAWTGGIQRAAIVAGWSWLAALQIHLLP